MRVVKPPRQRTPPALRIAALSALLALACAVASISTVSLAPPALKLRDLTVAGATAHAMIDLPTSEMSNRRVSWEYFGLTSTRADLLARVMASRPALDAVGARAGIPPDQIAAIAPVTAGVESALTEPGSEQRATEIYLSKLPYRLEIQSRPRAPLIDVYAQAPSQGEAERLADAAIAGLRDHLRVLATREGLDPERQVRIEPLGRARGQVLNGGAHAKIAALAFLVVFPIAFALLSLLRRQRRSARRSEWGDPTAASGLGPARRPGLPAVAAPSEPVRLRWLQPAPAGVVALPLEAPRARLGLPALATYGGDWPRTNRVLPWMLAAFMAVLWLTPFDSIQLNFSTPIDLKFDRMVLPVIFALWLLALVTGGAGAPRLRLTWIHAAVGAFVAVAGLSVLADATMLNRALELDGSLKKLPLLVAYLSLFVMLASVVRRTEVRAFLKYTLILAVICAVGMIWEYKTQYNVFFDLSSKALPGLFDVTLVHSGFDLGGRRTTHGPAVHGLIAVAMLAMAMPIALVGLIHARRWRDRLLYGLAACLLMAAVIATQRKTAILAPLSGVLTLAYFRRRELLRLAPLAVALAIAVQIASPGTTQPLLNQFRPDRLGANTVSDRASDYDAIRPDVWTNLALGRGYGSYQPVGHRILDSELLVRTVEMGVVGLLAFLFLGVSVIAATRALVASRHPTWAPPALAGAAAAVVFLVVAALFDTMSFPQVPYIFLSLAALVAALVTPADDGRQAS